MPVIAVNVAGTLPDIPADLPAGLPTTVMIHGYRYAPGTRRDDPHGTLLAGWARRLGFGPARRALAVGLGWQASGNLRGADARAAKTGSALALLIRHLRSNGAPAVNVIGHSLGARVALAALPDLQPGDMGRMVLLSGAEFRSRANAMLATPAGRAAEVLNVTSRENDLFDLAYEWFVGGEGPALGEGLEAANAVTFQIDHPRHRHGIGRLGFPVAPPRRLVCHWSAYTRPGMFPLYRAFLHRPADLPLSTLRSALAADPAPRWSRLLARGLPSDAVPAQ